MTSHISQTARRAVYAVGDTTSTGRRVVDVRRSQVSPARGGGTTHSGTWYTYYLLVCEEHGETWTAHPEGHCRACVRRARPRSRREPVVRLPVVASETHMLKGPGERRSDCTGYAGCLRGAALADGEWHCSPTCEHHDPIPAEALRAVATASHSESRIYPPAWST